MLLLLNGAAGGWDEFAIALVGLGVLWLAIKLAGRKRPGQDEDETSLEEEHEHPDMPRD